MNRYIAEMFGTFWLVLGGCGSAVLAAGFPDVGIGLLGVSLAFGLTVLTMAFALGHISGCHLNPAITIGLWIGGRFDAKDVAPYIIAQVIGGLVSGSLSLIADALHNLSDASSLFIALIARKIGAKPANDRYQYGYKRAEILATLFNSEKNQEKGEYKFLKCHWEI